MENQDAIKQLCKQTTSSITVNGLRILLGEAGVCCTLMGYYAWGAFSNSKV